MIEWMTCPKCGALMNVYTGYSSCPICGYRVPATVITTSTSTNPTEYVPIIRCKDCKHWDGYYCHNKWWGDGYGNYIPPIKTEDGFCDWADSKVSSNFE